MGLSPSPFITLVYHLETVILSDYFSSGNTYDE
jgi:hypothetical protein